ncbi:MAG: DUF3536 domain-containing protein [Desulfomonilaceae bacterium]|nr:DUF3536 domain-containing protein [Desulfomonilaceae bacterium]
MRRYICIHGHFYQPPRENPWLEVVEVQDSAYPYHDWNDRITAECYAPNASSRILDDRGRIFRLVNNYARMSFNFGPTLLAWMEREAPDVYEAILAGDRLSRENFSGHGSALAQAYNHMILPLANSRDKRTQIRWGIEDFRHRFQRLPEGMWLPETAVNLETLDIMAEMGIKFTILAPNQAKRIRNMGSDDRHDVSGGRIDPRRPYKLRLDTGKEIDLFVYHGDISQAVAFERLLDSGEAFAHAVLGALSENSGESEIVHVATDGESYGHHHTDGDMALAYALHLIESDGLATITNYGEYLEAHPPDYEIEIFENSSWSCVHGIERWRGNCGCSSGGYPHWNQEWRAPLREALDWLRDVTAPVYEESAGKLLKSPWQARDAYISLVLDRSESNTERFFEQHAVRPLSQDEQTRALKLLEMQRHAMLMYTSCGWFFDDLSGIETVQVIQYAGRVIQLADGLFGKEIEPRFLQLLSHAKSNVREHGDGRAIYEKWVKPTMLDLNKVGAHFAISNLFEEYGESTPVGAYRAVQHDVTTSSAGKAKLAVGRATVASEITAESLELSYGVLHLGDHNIVCGANDWNGDVQTFAGQREKLLEVFYRGDIPSTLRLLDEYYGPSMHSLTSLFREQQRRVLDQILEPASREAIGAYGQIYDYYAPLMRFLKDSGTPSPGSLSASATIVLNSRLKEALKSEFVDPDAVRLLFDESDRAGVVLDHTTLEFELRRNLERLALQLVDNINDTAFLKNFVEAARLVHGVPFEVNLARVQNLLFPILEAARSSPPVPEESLESTEEEPMEYLKILAENLGLRF